MAVNSSRSQNMSLREGATDGKYRKTRPDTQVVPGQGNEEMMLTRSHLLAGQYEADPGYPAEKIPLNQMGVPGM